MNTRVKLRDTVRGVKRLAVVGCVLLGLAACDAADRALIVREDGGASSATVDSVDIPAAPVQTVPTVVSDGTSTIASCGSLVVTVTDVPGAMFFVTIDDSPPYGIVVAESGVTARTVAAKDGLHNYGYVVSRVNGESATVTASGRVDSCEG